ncbi:hypothetical protein [Noviluteimonas dokdonensis]|uniref:hypothetical protein n=1 Tax=Noviluteimonas dokdonensis TaxID=414050 RepID=UPI00056C6402|nr:hypothetical protein [Lysobacter dokdonensis]
MTPDAVHAFISRRYPQLTSERRTNPDGWSFFLGPATGGPASNRIFRVVANAPNLPSRLKLSVTSRLTSDFEMTFRGDEVELEALIERELQLFQAHFGET